MGEREHIPEVSIPNCFEGFDVLAPTKVLVLEALCPYDSIEG